jgi:hypothetical protein
VGWRYSQCAPTNSGSLSAARGTDAETGAGGDVSTDADTVTTRWSWALRTPNESTPVPHESV